MNSEEHGKTRTNRKLSTDSSDSSGVLQYVLDEGSEVGEIVLGSQPYEKSKEKKDKNRAETDELDKRIRNLRFTVDKVLQSDGSGSSIEASSGRRKDYEHMLDAVKELGKFMFPEKSREKEVDEKRMMNLPSANLDLLLQPSTSQSQHTTEKVEFDPEHESVKCDSTVQSEITRLNIELSQRNLLIQYLARHLRDFCQANDRLFTDYEAQEANLTDQLRTLRARLAEATETLRQSTTKTLSTTSGSRHLVSSVDLQSAPSAVALLEFAGELQIRLISFNRNLIGDDTKELSDAAADLLTSWTAVNPSELTALCRRLFRATLTFVESALRQQQQEQQKQPIHYTTEELNELEARAHHAEAEVGRLNALVSELREELKLLNAAPLSTSLRDNLSESEDTVALCLSSAASPRYWPQNQVVWQDPNLLTSPSTSGMSPSSLRKTEQPSPKSQKHETHVYIHTPSSKSSPELVPFVPGDFPGEQSRSNLNDLLERLERLLTTKQTELDQLQTVSSRSQMEKFIWKQTEVDVLSDTYSYLRSRAIPSNAPLTTESVFTVRTTVGSGLVPVESFDRSGLYQSYETSPMKPELERSRSIPRSIGAEQRGQLSQMPVEFRDGDQASIEQRLWNLVDRIQSMVRDMNYVPQYSSIPSGTSRSTDRLDDVFWLLEGQIKDLCERIKCDMKSQQVRTEQHGSSFQQQQQQPQMTSVRIQLFEPEQLEMHAPTVLPVETQAAHIDVSPDAIVRPKVSLEPVRQIQNNLSQIRAVQADLMSQVRGFMESVSIQMRELFSLTVAMRARSITEPTQLISPLPAHHQSVSIQTTEFLDSIIQPDVSAQAVPPRLD